MNLLAIDASSLPASCAFFRGEMLVAEEYLHNRMTHSQTLMPMVEHMMQNAGATLQEVDAVAVTIGPGSFTGLRIGIAAAKNSVARACIRALYEIGIKQIDGIVVRIHALRDLRASERTHVRPNHADTDDVGKTVFLR